MFDFKNVFEYHTNQEEEEVENEKKKKKNSKKAPKLTKVSILSSDSCRTAHAHVYAELKIK